MYRYIFLIVILYALGCGESENSLEGFMENPDLSHYSLVTVDSIGIETGDSNYVFGMIREVEYISNGNIAIGDVQTFRISVFSPNGEFLRSGGRRGEGPGEYTGPTGFEPTSNGGIAISDAMAGKIIFLDSTLSLDHEVIGFSPSPPEQIVILPDGAIIGKCREFETGTGRIGHSVYRWEPGSTEESVTYYSHFADFDPDNIRKSFQATQVDLAASPDGRVFISPLSTEEYRILCYSPEGELIHTIERPWNPVERSEEDINREMEMMRQVMERQGRGGMIENWKPEPYYFSIHDLEIVGESQLWVQRGFEETAFFDVYSLEGEMLFTCCAEEFLYPVEVKVGVSEHGGFAYYANPESYPKVYILEMIKESL